MKNLRRNFERFCYRNRNKGIPNLMLWIAIGTALVYFLEMIDPSAVVPGFIAFDRGAILQGQVWRLFTYVFLPRGLGMLGTALNLYFNFILGKMIERSWGTFRFNLFYLSGILLTDIGALLLGTNAYALYIDLSLILAFATMFPDMQVLLMFIIPLKMKYLAWFYFVITAVQILQGQFPYNLLPLFATLNYFLFFGTDIKHVLPDALRGRKKGIYYEPRTQKAPIDFRTASQKTYRHKCTVCGRTDTEHPDLEFRYCSRCSGYRCYCIDHINDHPHIQ